VLWTAAHPFNDAASWIRVDRRIEGRVWQPAPINSLVLDKGFGFITGEDGVEYFFHFSAVRGVMFRQLRAGQRVEFTGEHSPKGPRAGDVRLIEGER